MLSHFAGADVLKSDQELKTFTERVMDKVGSGDLNAAFAVMKPFVVIPEAEFESLVVNTRAQRGVAGTRYGKAIGYECFAQEKLGQSLAKSHLCGEDGKARVAMALSFL
jgi:hypothetical protein